ncbi:MAG: hypothetical protein Q7V63_04200 [Gammaproteobacteria bacterium]|nr:hypothetical protein [Gammaproteobacteria bacterium]
MPFGPSGSGVTTDCFAKTVKALIKEVSPKAGSAKPAATTVAVVHSELLKQAEYEFQRCVKNSEDTALRPSEK